MARKKKGGSSGGSGSGGIGIGSLGDISIEFVVAAIVIAMGAAILAGFLTTTYVNVTVTNTTFDNTTTITVGHGLVSWNVYNDTDQLEELTRNVNYILWENNGSLIVNGSAMFGGDESVNYIYSSNSNATTIINYALTAIASFANWFSILVTIVIAVIVLSFVYLIRRAKGGKR